jgi:GPH family glycoside/pentoside/hexuronide:cation symporter
MSGIANRLEVTKGSPILYPGTAWLECRAMVDHQDMRRSQQLGWAAGSFGTAVMLGVLSSYGLFYMTTYLGISVLLAGQLIGLSKFYDLLTDPIMGQLSDRTNSRWGRRRPYLIAGAVTCPLALIMLFLVPDFRSEASTVGYLVVALLLYATSFTLFNVPYLAMPAEMTGHPNERTLIMSQRILFSTLGVLMISTVGPKLISEFGGGADGYVRMSWVMAAAVLTAMGLTFWLTRNARALPPSRRENYGLYKQWRFVFRNRPFRFYMLAKISLFMAQSSVQGSLLFFAFYVIGSDERILAAFGVGYTVGSLLSLPVWNFLISRVLGKRKGFIISALGLAAIFLSWLAAGHGEPMIGLYGRFFMLGIFSAGGMVSASAILPDIMEYDRRTTGISQEGLYAAAFSVVEKIANTIGPIIVGLALGLTGFISGQDGALPEQPPGVIFAIRMCVSVVPCFLAIMAAAFMRFYEPNTVGTDSGVTPSTE